MDTNNLIGKSYDEVGGCWGLVQVVYQMLGKSIPTMHEVSSSDRELFKKIESPEPYSIALFDGGKSLHVGVVLDDSYKFIHATDETGVKIDRLSHPLWRQRIRSYYRYVGN